MLDYLIARMRNSAMIAVFGAAALAVSVSAAAAQTVSPPLCAGGAVERAAGVSGSLPRHWPWCP